MRHKHHNVWNKTGLSVLYHVIYLPYYKNWHAVLLLKKSNNQFLTHIHHVILYVILNFCIWYINLNMKIVLGESITY